MFDTTKPYENLKLHDGELRLELGCLLQDLKWGVKCTKDFILMMKFMLS